MSVNVSDEAYMDVVELCALLQCLGFNVKSLDKSCVNLSQDMGFRSITIDCQMSGLHVVLESEGLLRSCPATGQQSSGSGMAGGQHLEKEFGRTILMSLPKDHRERLTKQLREMIRCIRSVDEKTEEKNKETLNKSDSMIELNTHEKRSFQSKMDTPTRYRSLDSLTAEPDAAAALPAPGPLARGLPGAAAAGDHVKKMFLRQSTYTLPSTPGSARRRNETPSPIISIPNPLLAKLVKAERVAEELRNKISSITKEFSEGKNYSSMSSLALEVPKITVVNTEPSKPQFASSPNLSGLGTVQEDFLKSRLNRIESASTSSLAKKPNSNQKIPRLRCTKDSATKADKPKPPENKNSKLNNFLRPKIATPVQKSRVPVSSPNLSGSKRKIGQVKSTIPRPTPIKKQ